MTTHMYELVEAALCTSGIDAPEVQPANPPERPSAEQGPAPAPASNIGEGTRFESWAE